MTGHDLIDLESVNGSRPTEKHLRARMIHIWMMNTFVACPLYEGNIDLCWISMSEADSRSMK